MSRIVSTVSIKELIYALYTSREILNSTHCVYQFYYLVVAVVVLHAGMRAYGYSIVK